MSGRTKIEWADRVWNPVTGCTPVSEGCRNCYAKRMHERFHEEPFEKIVLHHDRLAMPFHWAKPSRIFVDSMSDLFHPGVPSGFLEQIYWSMIHNPQHTFLILTKRPERMQQLITRTYPNIWLGVSVEDQKTADERIPLLLDTPAAVRFVSVEPMLGPVDLNKKELICATWRHGITIGTYLDWVICGGESGPGARPMHPDWVRSLRDQCQEARVPFFFKGWGEWAPGAYYPEFDGYRERFSFGGMSIENQMVKVGKKMAGRVLYGREWNEFPQVETPSTARASAAGEVKE